MAGPLDWLTSPPGTKQQYYQAMADGTHLVSVLDNGQVQDQGVVAAKAAKPPTDKPVVKQLNDGSTWAFAFNPDGTVAKSTQLTDPQGKQYKPTDPSLVNEQNARTDLINQQLANAEAMAPYNIDKAKATIDHLNGLTGLLPAQKDLIDARVQRIASQNSVDPSRIGLNNANAGKAGAQTSLYTAEGQMKLQNNFFAAKQQIDSLNEMVGKPGGPATQAEADALAQQIFDRAARETATGISSTQQAANALTAQRQAVDQANNRASAAASEFNQAQGTAMDAAKNGAGGAAAAGGFLAMLNAAPQFQANMGGAPVQGLQATPQAANMVVTPQHAQQVAQLVMSGQAPADANGNRVPAALKMVGQQVGAVAPDAPSVANGGLVDPNAVSTGGTGPSSNNFLSALGPGGMGLGASGPNYQGGAFS